MKSALNEIRITIWCISSHLNSINKLCIWVFIGKNDCVLNFKHFYGLLEYLLFILYTALLQYMFGWSKLNKVISYIKQKCYLLLRVEQLKDSWEFYWFTCFSNGWVVVFFIWSGFKFIRCFDSCLNQVLTNVGSEA